VGPRSDRGDRRAAGARHQAAAPGRVPAPGRIGACHAEAARWQDTDREQIVLLYDMLLHVAPSPVTRLHRGRSPPLHRRRRRLRWQRSTASLRSLTTTTCLLHAVRASLLRELGRPDEARTADVLVLALTANPVERAVLQERAGFQTGRSSLLLTDFRRSKALRQAFGGRPPRR